MIEESSPLLPPAEESIEAETATTLEPQPESGEPAPDPTRQPSFICDSGDFARSACVAESFYEESEGKRYCVLHFPDYAKRCDFNEALKRKFGGGDLNFRGVWFPDDFSLSGVQFSSEPDFSQAVFNGTADFSKASFRAGADFINANFKDVALFFEASFSAKAYFGHAIFTEQLDFSEARCAADIHFSDASFNAKADFSSAEFSSDVNFRSARFGSDADLSSATFNADAYFDSAKFSADADFSNAIFSGRANFGGTIFTGHADFKFSAFSSDAYFIAATFGAKTNFNSAIFSAVAVFESATFNANAGFRSATFNADALFSYATFNGVAYFNSANFRAIAAFNLTMFNNGGDFNNAVFSDSLSFFGKPHEGTLIDGTRIGERALGKETSLDFQHARIENPSRVSFHTAVLRPHWFVNVDLRKFVFTDVNWEWDLITIQTEIESLRKKDVQVSSPNRLLTIACRQLAENAEANNRYEEASNFRYWAMDLARRTKWRGWSFWKTDWLHMLYWAVSGYGERRRSTRPQAC